jgi:hypothetical protein
VRVCFISTFHMKEKEYEVMLHEEEIQITMNVDNDKEHCNKVALFIFLHYFFCPHY